MHVSTPKQYNHKRDSTKIKIIHDTWIGTCLEFTEILPIHYLIAKTKLSARGNLC